MEQDSRLQLTHCLFTPNSAGGAEAALFFQSTTAQSTATDCVFQANTKVDQGSIYLNSAEFHMNACVVANNEGKIPGIVLVLSDLYVFDSLFSNQKGNDAPFLYTVVNSLANITNTTFSRGFGDRSAVGYSSSSNLYLEKCSFEEMQNSLYAEANSEVVLRTVQAQQLSGLVWALNSVLDISLHLSHFFDVAILGFQLFKLTVSDSTFLNGLSSVLTCNSCSDVQIFTSSFLNCSTSDYVVELQTETSSRNSFVTVSDCQFANNTGQNGVTIWARNVIEKSSFERNEAAISGGAMWLGFPRVFPANTKSPTVYSPITQLVSMVGRSPGLLLSRTLLKATFPLTALPTEMTFPPFPSVYT